MPPTGVILPRSVISPVMASFFAHFLPVNEDAREVSIVIPAEGPSFGMAPSGTCMWTSCPVIVSGSMPRRSAWLFEILEGYDCRFLHDVAEIACEGQNLTFPL